MENATKALIIAAGVLIGMMIISLGVYLYYALSGYVTETQQEMEITALNKFNTQFLKYINYKSDGTKDFNLTIQDVVTAANIAYENNKYYDLTSDVEVYDESTLYVTVKAVVTLNGTTNPNPISIEKNINSTSADILKDNLEKKFKCTNADVQFSNITGRICSITFNLEP